ncbi:MAG: preprotein translocase subunit YajC [Thermoanaerobaculia bacterium]|nr:MAG: preprotein translocase subunit YajC [Thermoanaerobaculia bacterium]MBZ0101284.1 preprotein translocase subunit YajC [Thermoanaerobaculia bacterium]
MPFFLAQASAPGSAPSALVQLIPVLLIFAIFYFLLLAPMRKRQKVHQAMLGQLKRGDKVVTNGGLLGEIAAVEEKVVHLKLADNVRVRVARSAIAGLEGEPTAEEGRR